MIYNEPTIYRNGGGGQIIDFDEIPFTLEKNNFFSSYVDIVANGKIFKKDNLCVYNGLIIKSLSTTQINENNSDPWYFSGDYLPIFRIKGVDDELILKTNLFVPAIDVFNGNTYVIRCEFLNRTYDGVKYIVCSLPNGTKFNRTNGYYCICSNNFILS